MTEKDLIIQNLRRENAVLRAELGRMQRAICGNPPEPVFPCTGCEHGWGHASINGIESCKTAGCDRLKAYYKEIER